MDRRGIRVHSLPNRRRKSQFVSGRRLTFPLGSTTIGQKEINHMTTIEQPALYDELLDLYAETADVDRLLAFRLPSDKQAQLEALLQKNRDGSLTTDERGELEEYERLEHFGRMLKARLRQKQSP
jgi:hypothetical protein